MEYVAETKGPWEDRISTRVGSGWGWGWLTGNCFLVEAARRL